MAAHRYLAQGLLIAELLIETRADWYVGDDGYIYQAGAEDTGELPIKPKWQFDEADKGDLKSMGIIAAPIAEAPPGIQGRTWRVARAQDGWWYILGLPDAQTGEANTPLLVNPHTESPMSMAEELYKELYQEFVHSTQIKDGDAFATPLGYFICQEGQVVPFDEKAKRLITQVDESYRCAFCKCDQGDHRKRFDDNGEMYYGECTNHPECRRYQRRAKVGSERKHADHGSDENKAGG